MSTTKYADGEGGNVDKEAIPGLVLKRMIFDAQEEMYDCESKLMFNSMRNGGFPNQNDVYLFRVAILKLFRLVSRMALEVDCLSLPDGKHKSYMRDDWYLIEEDLAYGKPFPPQLLTRFSAYLTFVLHKLNLTNLLIDTEGKVPSEDTF